MKEIWSRLTSADGVLMSFIHKYLVYPFRSFTFVDALDILVLFVIIFWLYRFIKERRAGRLAVGLIVLAVISYVSSVLGMRAMHSLLLNFTQVGIVAIVVIFQPELRDALEKMGNTPSGIRRIGGQGKNDSSIAALISAVSEAATAMAADKTGALIIVERGTKLGEFMATGVEMDAKPSPELLRNIFFNKSPLHDGAVIIRGDRICAAGCILPSSRNSSVFVDMGTRHRAAVGITEISDAVAVVVSEENGIISIANNGIIKRNYNSGSLKEDLFLLLAGTSQADYHQKNKTESSVSAPADNTEEHGE